MVPTYSRVPVYQRPDEIVIEPSETDINQSDLDEGTVNAQKAKRGYVPPVNPQEQQMVSPRVRVAKANYYAPHERIYPAQEPAALVEKAYQAEQVVPVTQKQPHELTKDEWKNIQKRIDKEYERKLKEVGDDAMSKLQMYQEEHKALLEKTSYLIDAADEPQPNVDLQA